MIIVLTPEQKTEREHYWLNALLEHGLELCHIRKYELDDEGMHAYIKEIAPRYRERLVLHSHFHLADRWGIGRLHFSEKNRLKRYHLNVRQEYSCSTSVHSMDDFNALEPEWSYAFLSPVYPSISKPGYGKTRNVLPEFAARQNEDVKLIALGGIHEQNCRDAYRAGADGIGLSGSIWQASNPLDIFLKCRNRGQ